MARTNQISACNYFTCIRVVQGGWLNLMVSFPYHKMERMPSRNQLETNSRCGLFRTQDLKIQDSEIIVPDSRGLAEFRKSRGRKQPQYSRQER